ncbi:transcriptional regulator [Pyrococcus yayanosii]|uniref:Transcription regulator, ArsR family n=1 Tax=Pyrococcus yayanosii (strain CH1 / JCM 16557) TaxID=529709 RepID=F8AGY0_PYRYC|nr:transcriptional regulator [Pyrococcus yayanosii]AEH24038.1 Transcription regulator, ArsR family [Pyrococcus yayanosii CH1]
MEALMLYLLLREKALFKELLDVLEVTPGNLDSHLKALERAGYVKLYKVFADRPRTAVRITGKGTEETLRYLRVLRSVVERLEG